MAGFCSPQALAGHKNMNRNCLLTQASKRKEREASLLGDKCEHQKAKKARVASVIELNLSGLQSELLAMARRRVAAGMQDTSDFQEVRNLG